MKVIFAQGNPGEEYSSTRHNIGWLVLDAFAKAKGIDWHTKAKFFANIAEYTTAGEKVLLVKPTTFYNETGRSARALVDFYQLNPATDMLVVHDDLVLPFGTLRAREKGSDAGNNGVKSLNAHIGEHYARLRVGISSELRDRMDDTTFVLGKFTSGEAQELKQTIIPKTFELIENFGSGNYKATSHRVLHAE